MTWADAAVPGVAALASAAFAGLVAVRWTRGCPPHALAWTIGLALYAVTSLIEAYVALRGWNVPLYRAYFPLAAGLVGALGAGTVYLLGRPAAGHAFAALVTALALGAALGQFTVPLTPDSAIEVAPGETRALAEWGPDLGAAAVPHGTLARTAFTILSVVGGLALIAGALASWWRTRAPGVLLIGVGALGPFVGGSLSALGLAHARPLGQLVGIVVMLAGYLAGTAAGRRRASAPSATPAHRRQTI